MLDDINDNNLRNLIEAYDTYIQEANKINQYQHGWRPVSVETFYGEHFGLLNYLDNLEEDMVGVMPCEDFVISHLDVGQLPDFCENCKHFPDNCLGELPTIKLRNLLKQYKGD